MAEDFTFDIVSPKYGIFTVTAPEELQQKIEAYDWVVQRNSSRSVGRQFGVIKRYVKDPQSDEDRHNLLHRYIWWAAGRPMSKRLDHIDGNPLNNSFRNLRTANSYQNQYNQQDLRKDNTSGLSGVSWHKATQKWSARVSKEGVDTHLGLFETKEFACIARDAAALKYYGAFAVLNKDRRAI